MHSLRQAMPPLSVILVSLVLAACGGSSDSSTNTSASGTTLPSTTASVADATAISNNTATQPGNTQATQPGNTPITSPGNPQANAPGTTPSGTQDALTLVTNGEGASATFTTAAGGVIDKSNTFFQPFGNGRACSSCHQPEAGWSITPENLAARFAATDGLDPVFRTVDGANSPNAPVGTKAERAAAYSMLLTKGLIRVGLPMPAGAEFDLVGIDDPYGFASATEVSLFRRPLPTTNLKFQVAMMWDGRETPIDLSSNTLCVRNVQPLNCFISADQSLLNQAGHAVIGHAQSAAGLTAIQARSVVDFETQQFTTQLVDTAAGRLDALGALSGPQALAGMPFYFGLNDVVAGDYRSGRAFDPQVMNLFSAWAATPPTPGRPPVAKTAEVLARESIARGERIFNGRRFSINGVAGFNDEIGRDPVQGTCSSCHSTPNVGTHSVPRMMNTGVSAANRRTPDLPLYTLRNKTTLATLRVTDIGSAMQTGLWKDIGKMKVPSLRGIESRSPYFHDGSENDVAVLIGFYNRRFAIGLSGQDVTDLSAFLKAL
ncbi:MAG: cytochrome C [Burkholderiales bacterium]